VALASVLAIAAAACDSSDADIDDTVPDEVDSERNVPFDNDVPPGVDTDTDERNNMGFESDEPGPVGNQSNPNE
jgi:hypothetical protein